MSLKHYEHSKLYTCAASNRLSHSLIDILYSYELPEQLTPQQLTVNKLRGSLNSSRLRLR